MTAGEPTNAEIAGAFDELGDLYELDGAVVHRVMAYRNGAQAVRDATGSVAALARAGRATELPGIGATLQEKILALADGGSIPSAERLRERYPSGLVALTRLPGLGARRARRLFDELGVDSPQALRVAAESGRVRELRGFGPRAEARLLEALDKFEAEGPGTRVVLDRALLIGEALVAELRALPAAARVELAGSARRWADTVSDLDIVAASDEPETLVEALCSSELVESTGGRGAGAARVRTHAGLEVDLRIVALDAFGDLLQHLTGSAAHNVELREKAVRRGLHVSEHGVLDDATGETERFAAEEGLYARLGYTPIPPELREGRGELEAARLEPRGAGLPDLVALGDVRGDLHCHTIASDGRDTIEAMATAALERGYEYLAITDHSASHGFGNDVSPERLREHAAAVRAAGERLGGIELLAGSEVNVLPDGALDYDDELLRSLDWVVASVHTSFGMPREQMTARIVRAVEHPAVDVLGHPTGRKLPARSPYAVDLPAVYEAAARTGTLLEINANPNRRDLNDVAAREAVAAGATVVVSSDAHGTERLDVMRYGIATARRAWLRAEDVANTTSWPELDARRPRHR